MFKITAEQVWNALPKSAREVLPFIPLEDPERQELFDEEHEGEDGEAPDGTTWTRERVGRTLWCMLPLSIKHIIHNQLACEEME